MIHYELIVASASRPHLLGRVLRSFLMSVDQLPDRVIVHDDAVFPGKSDEVTRVIREATSAGDRPDPSGVLDRIKMPLVLGLDDPPLRHGPTLKWLLDRVRTEYVLYSQDDHEAVRPIPVSEALAVLDAHGLNQIRFNKRDTMDVKGEGPGAFRKVEQEYALPVEREFSGGRLRTYGDETRTLCAADHWYFQTGVWRVAAIKPVVDWWSEHPEHGDFRERCEMKINRVFNGEYAAWHPDGLGPRAADQEWEHVPVLRGEGAWNDPAVRASVHRTFIWGRVGEKAYVRHLGTDPADWADPRTNRDPIPERNV